MRSVFIIIICSSLFACKPTIPDDNNLTGYFYSDKNIKPLFIGNWADPSILKRRDDYFMVTNCGPFVPSNLIWHSQDLLTWTPLTYAANSRGMGLAPDLSYYNDKYYLYGGRVICYTADHPSGPWEGPFNFTPKPPGIDPCPVVDENGDRFMYVSRGMYCKMSPDGLMSESEFVEAYDGWPMREDKAFEGKYLESPKLTFRDGWYYMLSAQGGTKGPSTSHMIISARSRSPEGPWENDPENPILYTESNDEDWWSKGHGTAFIGPDNQWYMIFHGYMNGFRTLGRCVLLQPCEWTDDGWLRMSQHIPSWWEKPVRIELDNSDEFEGTYLGMQWQFYKQKDNNRYRFHNGNLILEGVGQDPETSYPLVVQPMNKSYMIETEFSLEGEANAGLILFYSDRGYIGMGMGPDRVLRTILKSPGPLFRPFEAQLSGDSVKIRIVNENQDVRFYYRQGDESWKVAHPGADVSYFTANAFGGFFSLRPGVYVHGEGKAHFERFIYTALD